MTHKQTRKQLETLFLIDQYKRAHKVEEADLSVAAEWAYSKGLWNWQPVNPVKVLQREMARALRGEYYEDPQEREVRKNHPVMTAAGKVVWIDIRKAKPPQMRLSFVHHRNRILAECRQLSLDFDSYNENNLFGAHLTEIDFDFTKDIEESKLPVRY